MFLTFPGQEREATPVELAPVDSRLTVSNLLTYRGVKYDPMAVEMVSVKSERTGMYRGIPYTTANTPAAPRQNRTLTYRGIRYNR